jgi:pimeloyl-ACP methyl ester carboxylesterase
LTSNDKKKDCLVSEESKEKSQSLYLIPKTKMSQDIIKLVFMPGLDGTGISFELLSKFLPADIAATVVRYPADRLLSFEEIVACAYDQMKGEQDIVLAESFSGPVAISLIASGRLKAKGLILCATFAKAPRRTTLKMLRWLPLELGLKLPFQRLLLRLILGDRKAVDTLFPIWQRLKTTVPARVLAHRIRLLSLVDVRHLLPELTIPCWYIQATGDRLLPSSVLDFVEGIPHLVVRKVTGPHFILQTEPEASAAIINEFINFVEKSRGQT